MKLPDSLFEFKSDLSDYHAIAYDGYCGEPVAWGYKIINYLGETQFDKLRSVANLKFVENAWYVVVTSLSRSEALEKYGAITDEKRGPRGGWKSVTFGNKTFVSDYLSPDKNQ